MAKTKTKPERSVAKPTPKKKAAAKRAPETKPVPTEAARKPRAQPTTESAPPTPAPAKARSNTPPAAEPAAAPTPIVLTTATAEEAALTTRVAMEAPALATESPTTVATAGSTGAEGEPRLPPVGTVLRKVARDGTVRCEATIVDRGIRYRDTVYRSLSAAALAAARDQGNVTTTCNGWAYWGLTKPVRASASPVATLDRAFERYHEHVTKRLDVAGGGARDVVLAALQRHARLLQNLHDEEAAKKATTPCLACGGEGVETVGELVHSPCRSCAGEGAVRGAAPAAARSA